MGSRLIGLLAAWAAFALLGPGIPASAQVLVQTRSWSASLDWVQWVGGQDRPLEVLVQMGERALVLEGPSRDWKLQSSFRLPMQPTGGLVLADLTGDGQKDLAVGGDGPGAVYVYRQAGEGWEPFARTDYLWNPVASLAAADVTGRGFSGLVASGLDGRVHLFQWEFGRFRTLWTSARDGYWLALPADLTGDGKIELVLARREGYVGVWAWRDDGLEVSWENYPWGSIVGLTLGDVDADGLPDIVLNTSRGLLYAFGWTGDGFVMKRHVEHPSLPFPHLAVVHVAGLPRGTSYVLASTGSGLQGYLLSEDRLAQRWSAVNPQQVHAVYGVPETGFLVWDQRGLRLMEPAAADHWVLLWQGEARSWSVSPFVNAQGDLMISARDLAALLDWQLYWNPDGQRLTLAGPDGFLVAFVNGTQMVTHLGEWALKAPVEIREGRVFLSYDVLGALGYQVHWDELSRRLNVKEP